MAFYKQVLASANGLKTNDLIEDWRHLACSVARSPSLGGGAYTIFSILRITAAVNFPLMKHYIRYGKSVLASLYNIRTQSVVQGVA